MNARSPTRPPVRQPAWPPNCLPNHTPPAAGLPERPYDCLNDHPIHCLHTSMPAKRFALTNAWWLERPFEWLLERTSLYPLESRNDPNNCFNAQGYSITHPPVVHMPFTLFLMSVLSISESSIFLFSDHHYLCVTKITFGYFCVCVYSTFFT